MIPDEAVEAATRALYGNAWDGVPAEDIKYVRAALEAAAPHMLAEAWDRALQDADDQGYLYEYQTEMLKKRNPYRSRE